VGAVDACHAADTAAAATMGRSSKEVGMRFGIVTPVVNLNPRFDPPTWERDGGIDDVVAVAQAAERFGYGWVSCPEHVAIPTAVAATRGARYWDPLATLSYVAASTSAIGLLSHVTVLGYHHPLELVKRWGTLDVISGGRVLLGVGVGSLAEEFALLGADFDRRGPIADEALAAIGAAWGRPSPAFHGEHFSFDGMVVDPAGVPGHLQLWVGGRTRRSLRRALTFGHGWIPFGCTLDQLADLLADPDVTALRAARTDPFEVVLAPEPPLDPAGDPAGTAATLDAYAAVGATALAVRFRHRSRQHYVEQLEALRTVSDAAR